MSDQTETPTSDDESVRDPLAQRPKTVSLPELSKENNSSRETEADESIGEAFFPPQNSSSDAKQTDTNTENSSDAEKPNTDNESAETRPKTVTLKSSDEHKKRLVEIGAVSSQEDTKVFINESEETNQSSQTKRCFSPKPKSERCYICGKEFLLSSLKIHEKQCAKKIAKENEKRESQSSRKGASSTEKVSANFPSKIPRKLKLEACYLCGKEFFSHSLGVHETQCIKNWKANKTPEAKEKSVAERAMVDQQGDESVNCETEAFHEQEQHATDEENKAGGSASPKQKESPKCEKKMTSDGNIARQKVLKTVPCYMCGAQLLAHSLKIHEKKCRSRKECGEEGGDSANEKIPKSCTEPSGKKMPGHKLQERPLKENLSENAKETEIVTESAKEIESPSPRVSKKPRTVACSICGQEFLKSSYAVHEKQCNSKSKARSEQELKLANNKKHAATPTGRKIEATVEGSPRKPKTQKCFLCGKEMLLSSLKIHEQQCQRKLDILKNINQQSPPAEKHQSTASVRQATRPKTDVCYICGEAFLSSSIKVHEVQCEKRWNANKKT